MKKFLYSIIIFIVMASAAIATYKHELISCTLIEYSKFEEIKEGVFVSPDTTAEQKHQLLALIKNAQSRIIEKFGAYTASPVVISSRNMKDLKKYTNNHYASTKFSLNKAYVILGEKGHNIDVVSHELVHAALFQRVGYLSRILKIPVWFDEGAAMQVDLREKYKVPPKSRKDLKHLKYSWQFFKGDSKNLTDHYSLSKEEVKNWLSQSGNQAFYQLLKEISNGSNFNESYFNTAPKR